jgi:23S rRNA (cytosine1962-C5)-methyltransferase
MSKVRRSATSLKEGVVTIGPRGVDRLVSGHLWIYRSDVAAVEAEPGSVVQLNDERRRFRGRAFYSDASQIAIRLLTREDVPADRAFFSSRLKQALAYRDLVVENAEAYRAVYSEGDLLPSLIVDRYGDYVVLQTLSQATERLKPMWVEILIDLLSPKGIIERNDPRVRRLEGLDQRVGVLWGDVPDEILVKQNGVVFSQHLAKGQKTGSFLDQRENQRAACRYASGDVLDCFCYEGGFALTLAGQASRVEGIDIAPAAIQAAQRNRELNSISNVQFREQNAFDALREYDEEGRRFQMVILDPPAFAKNRDSLPAAYRGYKEINRRALRLLKPGGFLITCSCSYHVSEATFLEVLAEAANDAGKKIAVAERRTQAQDHPILLTVPETHYLKCFIVRVLE